MMVVRLPDRANAAYTLSPAGLTASARGDSPVRAIAFTRARVAGSYTRTSLRRDTETKARCGEPANTTSAGSSPTRIVSTTSPCDSETMLTLSDTELTTHTSSLVRALTDTGSRPTGISAVSTGEA